MSFLHSELIILSAVTAPLQAQPFCRPVTQPRQRSSCTGRLLAPAATDREGIACDYSLSDCYRQALPSEPVTARTQSKTEAVCLSRFRPRTPVAPPRASLDLLRRTSAAYRGRPKGRANA